MKSKRLFLYLTTLILVFGLLNFFPHLVSAQCPNDGSPDIQSVGYVKGTHVSVYIDPSITGDARSATEQAFKNWNTANNANNSGVVFEFTTTPPVSGVGNYLIVNSGNNIIDPSTGTQVRAQTTYSTDPNTGYTTRGSIRLDQSMTNYDAVLEAMVHEIGHPMGLGHCTGSGCTPASSVMTPVVTNPPSPTTFNRTYGRSTDPTACDNQTLETADYPPCFPPVGLSCNTWDSNLCACMDYGGGSWGGGDDDPNCTPYYWCYFVSWDGGQSWDLVLAEYVGCW
jgi:hypothetical protein